MIADIRITATGEPGAPPAPDAPTDVKPGRRRRSFGRRRRSFGRRRRSFLRERTGSGEVLGGGRS